MATKVQDIQGRSMEQTRIFLQPVAGASMLGFFAFAIAAFVSGAQFAGWRGFTVGTAFVGPFLSMFFGIAEFTAAMWAFKARDGVSTAFHGIWGAFWASFGFLNAFYAGTMPAAPVMAIGGAFGYCFLALAFVSAACAAAALATNGAVFFTHLAACLGALAMTIGVAAASPALLIIGGYLFVLSAVGAWYSATAMVVEDSFGYALLPVGDFRSNREVEDMSDGAGEPGVLHGDWRGYMKKGARA